MVDLVTGNIQLDFGFIYNNNYYYYQKNLQGDVIRILDYSGNVVVEYTYDAWGKCTIVDLARGHEIAEINLTSRLFASAPTGADVFSMFFNPDSHCPG